VLSDFTQGAGIVDLLSDHRFFKNYAELSKIVIMLITTYSCMKEQPEEHQ